MASRSFLPQFWSILKGWTRVRAIIKMSGTTPVLQVWNYPALNSGTSGSYSAASTTGGGTTWPTQNQQGAEGVRSISRTGAGLWTVTLQDNYNRVLGISGHQTLAGGLSTIVTVGENSTITNITSAGGSIVGLALLSATATAADPGDGTYVTLNIDLQNATEP